MSARVFLSHYMAAVVALLWEKILIYIPVSTLLSLHTLTSHHSDYPCGSRLDPRFVTSAFSCFSSSVSCPGRMVFGAYYQQRAWLWLVDLVWSARKPSTELEQACLEEGVFIFLCGVFLVVFTFYISSSTQPQSWCAPLLFFHTLVAFFPFLFFVCVCIVFSCVFSLYKSRQRRLMSIIWILSRSMGYLGCCSGLCF